MAEFVALVGMRHRFGTPWRPVEQAGVERVHQEMQKLLGILLLDVVRTSRDFWSELLVVVEFILYTTPGPHGFTPRDIDRRWSVGSPLAQDLSPFEVLEFEPLTEYVAKLFSNYRDICAWRCRGRSMYCICDCCIGEVARLRTNFLNPAKRAKFLKTMKN